MNKTEKDKHNGYVGCLHIYTISFSWFIVVMCILSFFRLTLFTYLLLFCGKKNGEGYNS